MDIMLYLGLGGLLGFLGGLYVMAPGGSNRFDLLLDKLDDIRCCVIDIETAVENIQKKSPE